MSQTLDVPSTPIAEDRVEWLQASPFLALHLSCLLVLWVGWSWPAVIVAGLLYFARMFAITGFLHRYFSHRTFKTSRFMQMLFAVATGTAAQRGPLWWAAHHRKHHRESDRPADVHSPRQHGFLHAHVGWIFMESATPTDFNVVKDFARYPELRWLDRFFVIPFLALGAACWGAGALLESWRPEWGCNGLQMTVWGFAVSTVVLYHATYTINSLAHQFGSRRYETSDDSRNNLWLALLTLGEGWHNNHHHYPHSTRQGFRWWEIDISYYLLSLMARLGIVWDLRPVPADVVQAESGRDA